MPSSVPVVRPAAEKDLAVLQGLARRTIDARYRSFLGDEAVDGFLGSGACDEHVATHLRRGSVHCLESGGEVVGLAILDGATLDLMMIDVDRQRRGLGRVLLAEAEAKLFAEHDRIRLESFAGNNAASAFYEACGWSAAGPLETDGPEKVEYVRRRGASAGPDAADAAGR